MVWYEPAHGILRLALQLVQAFPFVRRWRAQSSAPRRRRDRGAGGFAVWEIEDIDYGYWDGLDDSDTVSAFRIRLPLPRTVGVRRRSQLAAKIWSGTGAITGDEAFDRAFEVIANSDDEARDVLHGQVRAWVERILAPSRRAWIHGGGLYLESRGPHSQRRREAMRRRMTNWVSELERVVGTAPAGPSKKFGSKSARATAG